MEYPYSKEQYTMYLIFGAFVVLFFIVYFVFIPYVGGNSTATMLRAKSRMATYPKVMQLTPLGCPTGDNTTLCDYYIASSAYSVFPSTYTFDYVSDSVIPLVIKAGARLVEVDVYAGEDDKPVVGLKNEKVGFDYAKNSVSFEKCCIAIGNTAFNTVDTALTSDPFILSIVFHTNKTLVLDACAQILKDTLGRYLLGREFSYHKKNLALEPICNLAGKVVIVSGGEIKHTIFEELVNLSWNTSNLRRLTYMQASQPYDNEELIEANRQHITMVVPEPDPDLRNNNPTILFSYGCQWNLMNYGSLDDMMEINIGQFQQGSVILKPEELRHKVVEAKDPVLPDPAVSFQPMAQTSPIYDSNPLTGDKSIVI